MASPGGIHDIGFRRWEFAGIRFDESTGNLTVDGQSQRLEPKLRKVLQLLLEKGGEVVTKEELLRNVWAGVHVIEASIPTAINKLRIALGEKFRSVQVIQTVPGVGYRLCCEARLLDATQIPASGSRYNWRNLPFFSAAGIGVLILSTITIVSWTPKKDVAPSMSWSDDEVLETLWRLDQPKIDAMLKAGWNPNRPLDDQGNGALNRLLEICEWNPGHDHQKLLLLARRLLDAGATINTRNVWGDTAYSIASAKRYCGTHHPVTEMLRAMCFSGPKALGQSCRADYRRRKP